MSRTTRLTVGLTALALVAGCAQEQQPINRVQPNYYDKSFFVGQDYVGVQDDPEFYSQGTLVDVGYGAGQDGLFTSTYAQPLSRVKWEVTEKLLIARLAYERVKDSDGKGVGKATNDGIVVAAYPITDHFDIRREYNPSTGEQLNVISENTVDRKWFERQFIRVDWSKNLSTDNYDFDTLSQMGVYGGISYEPLAYDVTDPNHEDAPHVDVQGGYLDITNKAFATPQMITLDIWGGFTFPACYLDADIGGGGAPTTQCNPVELTIRQSFRKVPNNDYEPEDWDGYRFQAFGAFTTDRKGYARDYGMTDTQWHRFINRYNIWERSHKYANPETMEGAIACFTPGTTPVGADPHRDLDANGTEDECESVGGGSRCDVFSQKCTLPYRERTPKTVVWYHGEGSHPDFFEPTRDAAHEWDVALRSAVMTARYAECQRTGGTDCAAQFPVYSGQQDDNQDAMWLAKEVDDCRAGRFSSANGCEALADSLGAERHMSAGVIALAKMQEMVVLCHSPVEANDPSACGTPRLPANLTAALCFSARLEGNREVMAECGKAITARKGDLRYHLVNTIASPQTPSPWGIMVDAHDPLTGEKVSASINVWSHVTDLWSQGIVDTARYIKGELTTADVTEGTYVREWASAAEAASSGGSLPKLSIDDQQKLLAGSLGMVDTSQLKETLKEMKKSPAFKQAAQLRHEMSEVRFDALQPSTNAQTYAQRRKRALNTPTEAALLTRPMLELGGTKLKGNELLAATSPLRGGNPSLQRELNQARELALAERGACVMHEAPAPLGIADLANILEAKFGAFNPGASKGDQAAHAERARKWIAQRAHYAVVTHEMGHSIALRHNFVSSSDAWNYRPQYWQLRTENGTKTTQCTGVATPAGCIGSRSVDPIDANEKANLIAMFMQSTTMDYAGEATQDMLGLGAYDFAAARMFYGDVTSVLADSTIRAGQPKAKGVLGKIDNFGGIVGIQFEYPDAMGDLANIHYSELQEKYGMIHDCQPVDPNLYKPAAWNEALMGAWHPVVDGLMVPVAGEYKKCKQLEVDYVNWSTLRAATATEADNVRSIKVIDGQNRVRAPYGFATDRWADLGNLSVYRHDNGADPYELFDFLITQQEVNHIFDNYRRGRQTFSVRNASNRTLSRYNEKLRDAAKGMGLLANIYRDFALAQGYDYGTLWPYIATEFFKDNMLASGLGFDHFARQMARPEAGPHMLLNGVIRSNLDPSGSAGTVVVNIPNGATGYFGNVSFGGRPMENALSETNGEYDSEYTVNVGSYYDKAWAPMLLTESVDNFISDSRRDFLDGRYRAVSMADLFPDGFRRWLGNNLTGDETVKGPRLASTASGRPLVDSQKFPTQGIGYTSWWQASPTVCFQAADSLQCGTNPTNSVPVDPQVGWEQQKFLIAMTLMYLPENAQQTWLDQMGIWELGADTDPGFANRIELRLPDGKTYIAKTFGKEMILGKSVQKGISARMLQYANELVQQAYDVEPGLDVDGDTQPDWWIPKLTNGQVRVKYDSAIQVVLPNGQISPGGRTGCNATDNSDCKCEANRACVALQKYTELPFFMRQAMRDYGLAHPSMKGIY